MTSSVAAEEEKKTEDGMMMSPPEPESNPATVAHLPEAQTLTPWTTEQASSIPTNCKI
jgi:hypothetical protein